MINISFLFILFILPSYMKQENIPASKDRIYKDVKFLTEINQPRNFENISSLNAVAEYIYNEFSKLECRVFYQDFKAWKHEYKNVIASFGSEEGERIVIGAHYDVEGNKPGADDNASAVAGLLEIARMLDALKPSLKYRIDFVAYTLEEPPFFTTESMGSLMHADKLAKEGVKLRAMICLEMIGYFSEEPNSQEYPIPALKQIYPSVGNFIAVVGKQGQEELVNHMQKFIKEAADIDVQSIAAPPNLPRITDSDHRNYWKHGYNAVMINDTSNFRNPNYHSETDTIDTLDFNKITEVVKGVYWAMVNL